MKKISCHVVLATRKELEEFFPQEITNLLPEEETEYGFGSFSGDFGDKESFPCPYFVALKSTVGPRDKEWELIKKFDDFCQDLKIE